MLASLIAVFALACAASFLTTRLVAASGPMQAPNARSNHESATPVCGGLGAAVGLGAALIIFCLWRPFAVEPATLRAMAVILASAGVLGALGVADDMLDLDARSKFALMAVVSIGLAIGVGPVRSLPLTDAYGLALPYVVGLAGSALWAFTVINAVNFMDGANGLAGGAIGVAAAALGCAGVVAGEGGAAVAAFAVAGGCAGFLPWNARPKARVFMGDAGSLLLGAMIAGVGLLFARQGPSGAVWIAPLAILPLLADVLLTLAGRTRRGARLFDAHKEHGYQRRLARGESHLRVSGYMALRMFACGVLVIMFAVFSATGPQPLLGLGLLLAGGLGATYLWRRDQGG